MAQCTRRSSQKPQQDGRFPSGRRRGVARGGSALPRLRHDRREASSGDCGRCGRGAQSRVSAESATVGFVRRRQGVMPVPAGPGKGAGWCGEGCCADPTTGLASSNMETEVHRSPRGVGGIRSGQPQSSTDSFSTARPHGWPCRGPVAFPARPQADSRGRLRVRVSLSGVRYISAEGRGRGGGAERRGGDEMRGCGAGQVGNPRASFGRWSAGWG
mmetsp:Transcript_51874/g.152997  ORF Transcript_51874/g.152997 Transcript_51874/m.152997 type:complete len:215 (+) Transcript_51874:185-829(+)